MNLRRVAAVLLCLCFAVLAAQTFPSSAEWSRFNDQHMMLMQSQAQTLVRLDAIEKEISLHEASQSGYPSTLAVIELKMDGIRAIFNWLVGVLTVILLGGLGFFWRLLNHSRAINSKLDAAVGIASERDVKHTNRERDIQSNQQFERRVPLNVRVSPEPEREGEESEGEV